MEQKKGLIKAVPQRFQRTFTSLSRNLPGWEQVRQRYRLLASQAVVLARLAGFVAAHLDVRQDPLRSNIEAMMAGYARHEHDEADHHDHHHHD